MIRSTVILVFAATAFAQAPAPPVVEAMKPSDPGLRLTPGMARGVAREFVRDALIQEYGIDKSREGELTEMVARRIMVGVQKFDTDEGQATGERMIATMFDALAEGRRQGRHTPVFTPELGKAFGRDMMTLMPEVRKLVRDVAQDIRPEMSMKQQMKMAGQLVAINGAMDTFEGMMKRWSTGEVVPGEDPFRDGDAKEQIPLGSDGASNVLRDARKEAAEANPLKQTVSEWERYVKEAKEVFGFDETQSATADSILREIKSRAEDLGRSPAFKAPGYQRVLWGELAWRIGPENRGGNSTLLFLLDRADAANQRATIALGRELKDRIDRIPRIEQQRKVDQQLEAGWAERGLLEESATQPAGGQADAK